MIKVYDYVIPGSMLRVWLLVTVAVVVGVAALNPHHIPCPLPKRNITCKKYCEREDGPGNFCCDSKGMSSNVCTRLK